MAYPCLWVNVRRFWFIIHISNSYQKFDWKCCFSFQQAVCSWLYLIFKLSDLFETVLLVLAKRYDLITTYHVLHHFFMVKWVLKKYFSPDSRLGHPSDLFSMVWGVVKFWPGTWEGYFVFNWGLKVLNALLKFLSSLSNLRRSRNIFRIRQLILSYGSVLLPDPTWPPSGSKDKNMFMVQIRSRISGGEIAACV